MSTAVTITFALSPVVVVYIFYLRYFSIKPTYLDHLEFFIYGILLADVILLINTFILPLVSFQSPLVMGFMSAAFVEKSGAFLFIYFLMRKKMSQFMVSNAVVSSMLLGIGFATFENIIYAVSYSQAVIIVRLFSAVLLHVLTCGLMGYYLSQMRLTGSMMNKFIFLLKAFVIPFVFHGLYDTFLISGGSRTYLIALILVTLIAVMEFVLARSQTLPLLDSLKKHNLHLEDWITVQREPQFERWILRSMGSRNFEQVPFFRLNIGPVKFFIILLLITGAVLSFFNDKDIRVFLMRAIGNEEVIMLFTLLPLLYAVNLLVIGMVNPRYFQNSIIKIPIIIDVNFRLADTLIKTIAYHVTGSNCFCKTVDTIEENSPASLTFQCGGFTSPQVQGEVIWDSHDRQDQFSGSLVRFSKKPAGYRGFLFRYYLYRILRGISFNLRLPGFENIRQLFVRPVSVMQKEWRYNPGTVLFCQGESGSEFYLIRKGTVEIIKTLDTGEEVLMATLGEGDIFGEMAIVGNQPRLATAKCKTDCLLAVAEADNLDALIENNPVFTQKLIKTFANRLHSSEEIMLGNIADMDQRTQQREQLILSLMKLLAVSVGPQYNKDTTVISPDLKKIAGMVPVDCDALEKLFAIVIKIDEGRKLDGQLDGDAVKKVIEAVSGLMIKIKKE